MAEIALEGISKRFPDGTEALRPLDLTIGDGELFILVGPSGCGKSTLLKLIVGLEQPTTGEVRVGGVAVTGRDPKDRNMAMVFQSYALYPHMTVRENMAFPLKLARLGPDEIARRVEEAAALLEVGPLLERKPAALSGGQRQRVAMGRAIVRQPAAFLLDEPLSNLDAKLRTQMRAELARLQRRLGTTTVYVTHDQTEAMTLGHRIAVLRRGEVQQVGAPRQLYAAPRNLFVAGFIGSPSINLLPAQVQADRLRLPMTELPLPGRYRGRVSEGRREVIVGVRPEALRQAGGTEGDGPEGPGAFRVQAGLVEWLGADLLVHFEVRAEPDRGLAALRRELAPDLDPDSGRIGAGPVGDGTLGLVARLDAGTAIAEGDAVDLCIDTDRLLLFDARTGERIEPDPGPGPDPDPA